MIVCIVRFETKLTYNEVMAVAKDRAPDFEALPGLIQKYYVQFDAPNTYGGVYVWESKEAFAAYRASNLAASISEAYKVIGAPKIEIAESLFALRS